MTAEDFKNLNRLFKALKLLSKIQDEILGNTREQIELKEITKKVFIDLAIYIKKYFPEVEK